MDKGKHNLRFGGQYTYIQLNYGYGAYAQAVEQLGGSQQDSMDDLVNFGATRAEAYLAVAAASLPESIRMVRSLPSRYKQQPCHPCPADSVITRR